VSADWPQDLLTAVDGIIAMPINNLQISNRDRSFDGVLRQRLALAIARLDEVKGCLDREGWADATVPASAFEPEHLICMPAEPEHNSGGRDLSGAVLTG
jgi:hypothetical protein